MLVHTGKPNAGHYFAYIQPKMDGKWFRFNDESVDFVIADMVFDKNFGGVDVCLDVDRE